MQTKKRRNRSRKRKGRNKNKTSRGQQSSGIGSQLGATIGNWAESGLRSLFGSGDYAEEHMAAGGFEVEDNSIVKPTSAANVPLLNTVDTAKDGMLRVKHREFLGDITTGTEAFAVVSYYGLNPQNVATFPWLSTIAGNFEQWIPHGIVFEFVSTCGNAVSSTNAALGSVSIATQYNVYSEVFGGKENLLNHYYAVSGKTADNLMHAIECAPDEVQTPIFNTFENTANPIIQGDDRLYFLGATTVYRVGSQSQYTAGELWITYDITLMKPRISKRIPAPLSSNILEIQKYLMAKGGSEIDSEDLAILRAQRQFEADEKKELEDLTRRDFPGPHLRAATLTSAERLVVESKESYDDDLESDCSFISTAESTAAARWLRSHHATKALDISR